MYPILPFLGVYVALISGASTIPLYEARNLSSEPRNHSALGPADDLIVDLGYERYEGVSNTITGLNTWFGFVPEVPK